MDHESVHWHEGMFLCPQHFQANDRYWSRRVATESQWDHADNYGVRRLVFDATALADHSVSISELEIRMRDGTVVKFGTHERLPPLRIAKYFEETDAIFVFICAQPLDGRIPAVGEDSKRYRYSSIEVLSKDENDEAEDHPVVFRRLNCFLDARAVDAREPRRPEKVAPQGFESMPLMRVLKTGKQESAPEWDESYYPPMIDVRACPPLVEHVLAPISGVVGRNLDLLSDRVRERGLTFSTAGGEGELDDMMKLMVLNRASAILQNLGLKNSCHPRDPFLALCALYGDLAIFGSDSARISPDIPFYDHDQLSWIFPWIRDRILDLVHTDPVDWEVSDFLGAGDSMRATIRSHWIHDKWDWYVGVRARGLRQSFLDEFRTLNWKLASVGEIDRVFDHQDTGVSLKGPVATPRPLPNRQGWNYYVVSRQGHAWRQVLREQTLALKVATDRVINRLTWNGQPVMKLDADDAELEFRLFAVPPKPSEFDPK